jgi:hypothetical protein
MILLTLPLLCASVLAVVIAPLLAPMTPVASRRAAIALLLSLAVATLALLLHLSMQAIVALPLIGSRLHSWLHLDGVHVVRGSSVGVIASLLSSVVVVKLIQKGSFGVSIPAVSSHFLIRVVLRMQSQDVALGLLSLMGSSLRFRLRNLTRYYATSRHTSTAVTTSGSWLHVLVLSSTRS